MTADLATGAKDARHPLDWYVEQLWVIRKLIENVAFDPDYIVWDPACGLGTIPEAFKAAGFDTLGTDIAYRGLREALWFGIHDYLGDQVHILEHHRSLSIVSNPPFSYIDDIAELFIRKSLMLARDKVAMLLPLKWRASEKRYQFFEDHPPAEILVFCDRPSMPPGNQLAARDEKGRFTAWARGKVDYAWFVWDRRNPGTPTIIRSIAPRTPAQKRLDREEDFRRIGLLPLAEAA